MTENENPEPKIIHVVIDNGDDETPNIDDRAMHEVARKVIAGVLRDAIHEATDHLWDRGRSSSSEDAIRLKAAIRHEARFADGSHAIDPSWNEEG